MGFEVLGIDANDFLEFGNNIIIVAFEEEDSSQVIARNPVARILRQNGIQVACRFIVFTFSAQHPGKEIIRTRQIGLEADSIAGATGHAVAHQRRELLAAEATVELGVGTRGLDDDDLRGQAGAFGK